MGNEKQFSMTLKKKEKRKKRVRDGKYFIHTIAASFPMFIAPYIHILKELQNEKNYFCSQEHINVELRSFCEKKLQGENRKCNKKLIEKFLQSFHM